jgi:hypothetical protein
VPTRGQPTNRSGWEGRKGQGMLGAHWCTAPLPPKSRSGATPEARTADSPAHSGEWLSVTGSSFVRYTLRTVHKYLPNIPPRARLPAALDFGIFKRPPTRLFPRQEVSEANAITIPTPCFDGLSIPFCFFFSLPSVARTHPRRQPLPPSTQAPPFRALSCLASSRHPTEGTPPLRDAIAAIPERGIPAIDKRSPGLHAASHRRTILETDPSPAEIPHVGCCLFRKSRGGFSLLWRRQFPFSKSRVRSQGETSPTAHVSGGPSQGSLTRDRPLLLEPVFTFGPAH